MKISPNYTIDDWLALDLRNPGSKDWSKAIDIFDDRIKGRFLKQLEVLMNNPDKGTRVFSGFVIVAVDCLLIETLQQFYNGKNRTGNGEDASNFYNFFQRSEELGSFFDTIEKAQIFYNDIRCGLLHQAQTKHGSMIHIRKGTPTVA